VSAGRAPSEPEGKRLRGLLALALSVLLTAAAGCASPKRDECRAVTTMMNVTAERIEKAQATPLDPGGLKALAEALDKSAGAADALKLSVPDVQKQAKTYAAVMREVAQTARDMAAAGEALDKTKAETAGRAMEQAVAKEPPVVAETNKICLGN
jgi:hypothetical protein